MLSDQSKQIAAKAKAMYEANFRSQLEEKHHGEFVCIEPESGDYFLGQTFDEAVNKAIDAYPDRLTYTLRVGHAAAFHLGVMKQ